MKILQITVAGMALSGMLFAANFNTTKEKEIKLLTQKQELIQKRLQCVKSAKNSKALKECKKKYSLINRKKNKIKNKAKNIKKAKMSKYKNKKADIKKSYNEKKGMFK